MSEKVEIMSEKKTIAVVAPGRSIEKSLADRVLQIASALPLTVALDIRFHPQCFRSHGHFAGDDATRANAFLEAANDPDIDAVWFARGGYGACRFADGIFDDLTPEAKQKQYLGYSDGGMLLARLFGLDFPHLAHGPMPADLLRQDGDIAVARALRFLSTQTDGIDAATTECDQTVAFNLTVLSHLVGTAWMPPLDGRILFLEDVGEYHYRIDRSFFTVLGSAAVQRCAGVRLGRFSDIPENDIDFSQTVEDMARYWCQRFGIKYLGRCDIGHDIDNKIVPFR